MLFNACWIRDSGSISSRLLCDAARGAGRRGFPTCVAAGGRSSSGLRTRLRWEDVSEPRQDVHAHVELPWEDQDWSGISGSERDQRLAEFLGADRRRGFELTHAPLFTSHGVALWRGRVQCIWTVSPQQCSTADRWCWSSRRCSRFMKPSCWARRGISIPLPRCHIDTTWTGCGNKIPAEDEAFWRETLKGFIIPTPLVVDHAPSTHQEAAEPARGSGESRCRRRVTSALRTLAQDNQLTSTQSCRERGHCC